MTLTEAMNSITTISGKRLPGGWHWASLGAVCESRTGTRDPASRPNDTFYYVDISSVDNEAKRIVSPKSLLGKDAPSRARQVIHADDVIVSTTRPNLNAVALVPPELDDQICSTGFCVLRTTDAVHPAYLFAFVQSTEFVEKLSDLVRGALYPAVTDKQVREQLIPVPPLPEQQRIAALLTEQMAAVERARRAAEARIEAAEGLADAYLREVFGSAEAQQWPKSLVREIAETCSGTTPPRGRTDYYGGQTPWIKTGELRDNIIYDSEEHVSELAMHETSLRLLPVGTLLVAMYGQGQTRGRTGLLAARASTNQACFAILPNPERFDSTYLQWWFRQSYSRLRSESEGRGGNQPNLNGDVLRGQQVPLPSLDEQRHISAKLAERMEAVVQARTGLAGQFAAINQLPAAILRQAFSGAF